MTMKTPFIAEALDVIDIDQKGRGVARHGEVVVFIEHAIPGDIVDARVFKKKSSFWEAAVQNIVKPSEFRTQPQCQHFGTCGGCKWQHFDYKGQLLYKAKSVTSAFQRIGGLTFPEPLPILPSDTEFHYRNKLDFSFSARAWVPRAELPIDGVAPDSPALGFHLAGVFDKVLPISECLLMPNIVNDIRNEVRNFTILNAWPYFHLKTQAGWLRNLVVRMSESSGEIMVMLMVTAPLKDAIDAIFDNLKQKFPQISSFIWYVNDKRNDSYSDLKWHVWGESKPYIIEKLGKWQFYVSPNSFFQTNSKQANALYQKVYEAIGDKVDTLYDLYCGAGSISIFVSDKAQKIVGLEFIRDAVADARKNADLNGLSHLEFFAGDIRKMLNEEFVTMHGQPDVVITDPPRAGMEPAVVEQLLAIAPKKIIYVSCNPASQARDISLMKDHYTIESVQPVDMFPQTTHVENITVLIRNSD